MLIIENQEHFDRVVAFAKEKGLYEDRRDTNNTLSNRLRYLETYGGKDQDGNARMRVRLSPDFAPFSFFFLIERKTESGGWSPLFNGGLLYHGPHDGHGSGAGPTYAVSLGPEAGFTIHT